MRHPDCGCQEPETIKSNEMIATLFTGMCVLACVASFFAGMYVA